MMKMKDETERAKLEALCLEMRGKEYAYDHTGAVVLVTRIDPSRLPKPMYVPAFQLATLEEDDGKKKPEPKGKLSRAALLISKLNKTYFFRYFDPENISVDNENK